MLEIKNKQIFYVQQQQRIGLKGRAAAAPFAKKGLLLRGPQEFGWV